MRAFSNEQFIGYRDSEGREYYDNIEIKSKFTKRINYHTVDDSDDIKSTFARIRKFHGLQNN